MDRTYWHVPGARSWHASDDRPSASSMTKVACGMWVGRFTVTSDRLPPTAHLCGNCSRIIAARTDIEEQPYRDNPVQVMGGIAVRLDDIPEPVASEQDDSGVAPI